MQSRADGAAPPGRSRWRTATLWFGFTLLLGAIAYVLLTFRWAELADVLAATDALLFLGGGGATILVYWLLRTARWSVLLGAARARIAFKELYLSTAVSLGLAIVTPLQSGEAGKVEWLKRRGKLDRKTGYSAYALERVLDLAVVCAFGLVGLGGRAWSTSLFPWLIAALGAGVLCLAGIARFARLDRRFGDFLASFQLLAADTGLLLKVFGLTVASWLVVALGWYLCLASLSIALSAGDSLTLLSLITLVNVLSFVPGAWGVSEIGIAEFLRALGHEPAAAQAGAIILRGYGMLTLAIAVLHVAGAKALALLAARRAERGLQR
jgi:uncharacterized membrane protein YbhN (UPF0104 family)